MFKSPLVLQALDAPGEWVLTRPLLWEGKRKIEVPAGFVTDLASIPAPLRGLLNVNGKSRRAAVLHDWLYCSQLGTRAEADATLREALQAEGVTIACWVYWLGVRIGGWRYYGHRKDGLKGSDFTRRR